MPNSSWDDLLKGTPGKKPLNLEKLSRYTIANDRWDRRDFEKLLAQQPEVAAARQKLADNVAGNMAYDEAADIIWMLQKVRPVLLADTEIRPSRLLNARVNEQVEQLPELSNLRRFTEGDSVASALAFEKMEPKIETLYDQLKDLADRQQAYEDALKELLKAREDQQTAEEMLQEWLDEHPEEEEGDPNEESEEGEGEGDGEEDDQDGDGEGEGVGEKERLEQVAADAKAKADAAGSKAQDALDDLESGVSGAGPQIRQDMADALEQAETYLETIQNMASSWGSDPGQLMRLPAERRIELARKLDTPKFIEMAKLIGPMTRDAFAQKKRKTVYTPEEIVDLTLGDDIPRLIPPEFLRLDDEDLEYLFLKDLVQKSLVQYDMRGFEEIARGGIIYCHDGSLSMAGQREIWAKAVGLALLHVARKEKRSFYGIQFGSAHEIRIDRFPDTTKITPEQVIDFAEYFFNGGTNFESPLREAMKILQQEHDEFGAVQSDIVFATDGEAPISDAFMQNLKLLQAKLDFKVWGIAIGAGGKNDVREEPLYTLCDGEVATITTLLNAKDIREVFKGIQGKREKK